MTEIKSTFGDRIKELRNFHKMTQKTFSEKIGVSAPTVSDYESNKCSPSENTFFRLCQYFGVTKKWLIDGIGEMYPTNTVEEIDNLPMPDTEIMERTITKSEKRKAYVAKEMGISIPMLNDLMELSIKDNSTIELFVKAISGDEAAKKELIIKLLSK